MRTVYATAALATALACATNAQTAPAGDPALDFILSTTAPVTTRPAAAPTTAPTSPLVSKTAPAASRRGTFTFSDGTTFTGGITTTLEKPLRIWVAEKGAYDDVPFQNVESAEASIVWERDQPEYQFLTSGSDVKTFTGRTYPARETVYTLTLRDGRKVKGSIVAPFDVQGDDGKGKLIVLSKRDKGAVGTTLKDLVYVTQLTFE